MSQPTRMGKLVFDELQKLPSTHGITTAGLAGRLKVSESTIHAAYRNIRRVLGPTHGEPLVYFTKNGTYYYRLSGDAQEIKDYGAVRLSSIISQLRTQADVAEAGYAKTGDPDLYATARSLRKQAASVEDDQKLLLGIS